MNPFAIFLTGLAVGMLGGAAMTTAVLAWVMK